MTSKQQASDDSKSEYALELQKTNNAQKEHYEAVMPQIFQVPLARCLSRKNAMRLSRLCRSLRSHLLSVCLLTMLQNLSFRTVLNTCQFLVVQYITDSFCVCEW